jgi:hypothetical protein
MDAYAQCDANVVGFGYVSDIFSKCCLSGNAHVPNDDGENINVLSEQNRCGKLRCTKPDHIEQ